MLNKKGFTLIEMLGTVLLLLILIIIFTPSLGRVLRKSNELSKEFSEEYVLDAARVYVGEVNKEITSNLKTSTDYEIISLESLENLGLIQEDDIERLGPTARVRITVESDSRIKYEIVYDDTLSTNTNPYTVLLGNTTYYLNQGSDYNEAGWLAFDKDGNIITSNVVVTGTVNPNVIGSYVLTYDLIDGMGNVAETQTRTVVVVDSVAPIVSSATITSNNIYNNKFVRNNETLTLNITFSKDVTNPTVTIEGRTATVTGTGSTRTATYTIPAGETDLVSKALEINISNYKDIHDNAGVVATSVTSGGLVVYDNIKPVIISSTILSNNANDKLANNGDIVTLTTTFSEPTIGVISKIGGRTTTVTGENTKTSTGTYTIPVDETVMAEGDLVGEITQYMDRAGNVGLLNNINLVGITVAYSKGQPEEPAISQTGYDATKGVNVPTLTTGLTPVVWNGSAWVSTTESDPNWYSYTTTDKKWANAVSNDGSMWVWIPRFAYQLSTNFHTNSGTGGTMNVKLLMGNTNDTSDATVIALSPTYSGSSQTNYVLHPAFTFGDKELRGFWMAKFEATMGKAPSNPGTSCGNDLDNVTTENVKIINNISAWRCISVSNAFTNVFNMQTKQALYGWLDTQVDTHLMKNTEWSAVGYLSQSAYGKGTANIWLNPSSTYTTGCSGTAAGQSQTATCIPYYTEPRTGTTTNVYGVFDMSGGSSEYTAAYVNNIVPGGGTYINGQSVAVADPKYKDVYSIGTTDTSANNYTATQSKFGDSMWETSSSGSVANSGWYLDESLMPTTTSPWFVRGAHNRAYNGPGLFAFYKTGGGKAPDFTFRPVLLVGNEI